ncbi:MAG: outer membrane lipoprotein-sorting protein [Desulfobacula sp.]|nr:outer membrane lipoprotein-sorting protein [Desulfobacula sp.]
MMKRFKLLGCIIIVLLIFSFQANAEEITGKVLAQKIFDRDVGKNSISNAQMLLVNKNGNTRTRLFINQRMKEGDFERQIIRFTSPADIDGTGFLTIEKPGWETEQFLFLPALRRTRRIVSSQKSHKFVNSDFTYEDMERHPVEDYTYKIIGSKTIGNLDCYELETRPKKGIESQYSLVRSLVSKRSLVSVFVQYFDQKGRHIKTYKVLKLDQVQGIWTESTVSMEDLEKKHKTYIKLEKITYNTDMDKDLISRKSLENY